jgi:hypothetical protein
MTLSERERRALQEIADATMASDAALVRRLRAQAPRRFDPMTRWVVRAFAAVVVTLFVGGLVLGDESLLAGAGLVLVMSPVTVWCTASARRLNT